MLFAAAGLQTHIDETEGMAAQVVILLHNVDLDDGTVTFLSDQMASRSVSAESMYSRI